MASRMVLPLHWFRKLAALALALCATFVAATAESARPMAAMAFTLERGAPDACGTGCSEWIAAEGSVLAATPTDFAAFLAQLGETRPPVLVQSPGGTVEAAMAMGRLLRRAGLVAIVARTDRSNALPAPALDGECHGACLYLLAAGTERAMAPGAIVTITPLDFPGPADAPFPAAMRSRLIAAGLMRVRVYLSEMGIDTQLADYLDGDRYEPFFPDRGLLEMTGLITRDQPFRSGSTASQTGPPPRQRQDP